MSRACRPRSDAIPSTTSILPEVAKPLIDGTSRGGNLGRKNRVYDLDFGVIDVCGAGYSRSTSVWRVPSASPKSTWMARTSRSAAPSGCTSSSMTTATRGLDLPATTARRIPCSVRPWHGLWMTVARSLSPVSERPKPGGSVDPRAARPRLDAVPTYDEAAWGLPRSRHILPRAVRRSGGTLRRGVRRDQRGQDVGAPLASERGGKSAALRAAVGSGQPRDPDGSRRQGRRRQQHLRLVAPRGSAVPDGRSGHDRVDPGYPGTGVDQRRFGRLRPCGRRPQRWLPLDRFHATSGQRPPLAHPSDRDERGDAVGGRVRPAPSCSPPSSMVDQTSSRRS